MLSCIHTCKNVFSHDSAGASSLGCCLLQIRALTELCLFTEAVKESVQLTQGTGLILPYGRCIAEDSLQV